LKCGTAARFDLGMALCRVGKGSAAYSSGPAARQ
jgi:hypothetical protein